MKYVTAKLDADKDGWPEGLGNVERTGMGEEKLDNAVYLIRGLYDFADMATRQAATARREVGARASPTSCASASTRTWWDEASTPVRRLAQGRRSASSSSTGSASRRWRPS